MSKRKVKVKGLKNTQGQKKCKEREQFDRKGKALGLISEIDGLDSKARCLIRTFYLNKYHVALGAEDSVKGCISCLKTHCMVAEQSTLYRYIQVAEVEIQLNLKAGLFQLTLLLKLYKYASIYWHAIWETFIKEEEHTVRTMERVCSILEINGVLPMKSPPKQTQDFLAIAKDAIGKINYEDLKKLVLLINEKIESDAQFELNVDEDEE